MMNNDGNKSITSTNKWKYVPGKVFTLTPLNLQDIRNQVLDTSDEDSEDSENTDLNQAANENKMPEVLNKSFNAGSPIKDGTLEEIQTKNSSGASYHPSDEHLDLLYMQEPSHKYPSFSNSLKAIPEDTINSVNTPYSNDETMFCEEKENIPYNVEPLNLSRNVKKNDSFDLDFSALSLHTPVKKVEKCFNYVTPKINIIPSSETKSIIKGLAFKTPNVANKQYPFSKPLFKTPVNKPKIPVLFSAKKHVAAFSTANKSGQINMDAEVLVNQKVKPVINSSEDGFNRISVNDVEYIVMSTLGRGGSSEVFNGFNPEEKMHVAIKVVALSDPTTAKGYINEVKLLESLQTCDKIIKMYDYEIQDNKLIVVLEKGGEDLSTILKQLSLKQSHLPIYMLLFYWMEMLYAVKQIHENAVIHSDLKPANFLKAEGGLKLIDFGIASKVLDGMTSVYKSNQEGSCNYISPEALNQQTNGNVDSPNFDKPKYKVHFKSDVWSLGCILYQLVYRTTPFHKINHIWAKLAAITDHNYKIQYPPADWVSSRIVNTIKRCLQHDIKSRPSVDDLIDEYEQLLKTI